MSHIDQRDRASLVEVDRILRQVITQDEHPLTMRQFAVLLGCYLRQDDQTVRRLAIRLRMAKPSVSRILDHLVTKGLVERNADPRDRRSVLFARTPAGTAFIERTARHATAARARATVSPGTAQKRGGARRPRNDRAKQ